MAINSLGDEPMILAQFEADGPVAPERLVGEAEHDERRDRKKKPEPSKRRLKGVIGESGKAGRNVNQRHDAEAGKRNQ